MTDRSLAQRQRESTEERPKLECRSCLGVGWIVADADYDATTGELTEESVRCFICGGSGLVFAYGPRARRR